MFNGYDSMRLRKIGLIIPALIFCSNIIQAQPSKKGAIAYAQQRMVLNISEIQRGEHLEMARAASCDEFVQYYLGEGKVSQTKKYGFISFDLLYRDSLFAYFGRISDYGLNDFIKVKNAEFPPDDFIALDGQKVREQFIEEVIPEADKNRVKQNEHSCMMGNYSQDFKYKYRPDSGEIEVQCKWKIGCDFVSTVINETYTARYSIDKRAFIK